MESKRGIKVDPKKKNQSNYKDGTSIDEKINQKNFRKIAVY